MLVGEVFARMGLDSKQYEKGLDKLEGVTQKRAMTLGSIFKGAFSVALGIGVFEAVKMGFQTIASTAIGFNAQMEQARIGFTTMLGSAERAEAFLRDMADFAAKTPFEFPELLDASKRMLAYGFAAKDVLPTMEAVGNASAAVGLGTEGINRIILALGQMRAKGKVSAEEMRQLTETGIPAWEILAEAMNKTTAEIMDMQSKGLIPADRAIKMLVEGMNKRFPNMMKNMENTWEGVTSTIKDIWQMTIGKLTENLFEGLKTWLQGVRDWMSDFYDTFQQFGLQAALAKSFGPEIAALVSILSAVMRGFGTIVRAVTGFITQYGKQIKFVAIVMGTYLALTKAVTLAKKMMIAVTAVERGQLLAKIPVLNVVSTAMGIYRVQMALAAAQGIVLTGVLAKLRVALFALWSALGPVGWIILGLSAAVGVGTHLWGKYTQSLQKTASLGFGDFRKAQDGMAKSAGAAADATEDQTDALKKAGKAANKNLQSFDEVHQLQEDMAGSAEDLAESMGFDDTELGAPGAGGFEIPDIEAQLEEMKPTLKGFWEWIKQGAGNLWEGVKEKWNNFIGWVSSWGIWTTLKEKWSGFKEWAGDLWEGVKEKWENFKEWAGDLWEGVKEKWENFKEWAGDLWEGVKEKWENFKEWAGDLWEGVKEKWENFKEWAGDLWEGVKEKWGNFTDWVQEKWSSFKTKADEIWTGIKTNVQTKWEELKTNAPVIWEDIKTSIQTRWENLKTSAGETWNNITTGIEEKWNSLKTNAPIAWENIKTSIQDRWDSLVSGASEKWGNIKSTISEKWEELKTNAPTVWENIKDEISQRWEELKTNAPITWGKIKKEITDRWEALKKDAPETWENIKKSIAERWEELKTNAPITWGKIKKEITDRWEALKKDAPETWENIKKSIAERWEKLKIDAPSVWENIKKEISNRWETLKIDAPIVWENIKKGISERWEALRTSAPTTWEEIRKNISDRWEALKTDAPIVWENIKTSIQDKWENLKANAPTTWENIKKEISDRWEALKTDAPKTWGEIAGKLADIWEGIKTSASEKWEGIKSAAKTAWEWIKKYIIDPIQGAWTWLEKTWGEIAGFLERTWNGIKKTAGDIWENGIVGVIKGAVNSLIGAIEGGLNYVITGINSFIQKINDKIKQLNKVPGVNISTISPIGKIDIPRLAKGTNYVPQDMFAFLHEGEAVVPKKYNPDAAGLTAEAMEQAVYRAFINALRVIQTSSPQSSDDRELVLKIDNTVLARMQLPAIIREGQRQGLNLVVQPQGV